MSGKVQVVPRPGGDQWPEIDRAVEEFSRQQNWPQDLDYTIRLILEELVLNAVSYGSDDKSTEVSLQLTSNDDEVRIQLSDNGKPFNPFEESPAPDLDATVEDRRVGGLGVYFVKTLANSTTYERVDGHNRLTVVKLRS